MPDTPAPTPWLVVGLGNPGPEYTATRHNIGFRVVDGVAAACRAPGWKRKHRGLATQTTGPTGELLHLLKPLTYMNLSGESVEPARASRGIEIDRIIVVHDEVDLPFGRLRLKAGGGLGGHRGLISLEEHLEERGFLRVRFGVGRDPDDPGDVAGYVLEAFADDEESALPDLIDRAVDAVLAIMTDGIVRSMNQFNARPKPKPEPEQQKEAAEDESESEDNDAL